MITYFDYIDHLIDSKILKCFLIILFLIVNFVIYIPFNILSLLAWIILKIINIKGNKSRNKADLKILDIKDIFDFKESNLLLEELAKKPPSHQIFENFFIEGIINLKWKSTKQSYLMDTLKHLYFLIFFTLETIYMIPTRVHPVEKSEYKTSLVLSSFVFLVYIQKLNKL